MVIWSVADPEKSHGYDLMMVIWSVTCTILLMSLYLLYTCLMVGSLN
jgi:hypothetical protein